MSRWIAAGILGAAAAAFSGGVHGYHNGTQERGQQQSAPPAVEQPAPDDWGIPGPEPGLLPDGLALYRETAVHEAGHAAAAREFGIPVSRIEASPDGSGQTVFPDHYYRNAQRDAYDAAVIDVAGQEAAIGWLERTLGYSRGRALSETAGHARVDLGYLPGDAARAGITESQARQKAREIIAARQAAIDRTAGLLIDRGGELDEWELER